MFQEILRSQIHVAIGAILLFAVLGAVAGFVLALPAYFLSARAGAFDLGWKHDKWLRVAAVLWLLGAFVGLGGTIGGCEGSLRGLKQIVEKSQFRTDGLRRASACTATLLLTLDMALQNEEAGKPWTLTPEQDGLAAAFAEGKHEIDVKALLVRLEQAETQVVRKHLPRLMGEVRSRLKIPESRLVDSLAESALEALLRKALRDRLGGEIKSYGADVGGFLRDLPEAARPHGDPRRLSLPELCTHIEERIFIPLIMTPARGFVRAQQLLCLLGIAGAWLLPVLGFWIGRKIKARREKPVSVQPLIAARIENQESRMDFPPRPPGGKGGDSP